MSSVNVNESALSRKQSPFRTVETLAPFLNHSDPLLRLHAIQNLMKSGVKDFNDKLRALSADDEHELVRQAAELALSKLSPLPQHLNN